MADLNAWGRLAVQATTAITFVIVLVQAWRHRSAQDSLSGMVQQAHDKADRAAQAATTAALVIQPLAADLAIAVSRLPVQRKRSGPPLLGNNGAPPSSEPPAGDPQ